MKQPELGSTIIKLRQEKNLTQEELVEQCNISVRTLQRIEAGDVTPRDYTIKTILSVLNYELEAIESSVKIHQSLGKLQYAWMFGIIYFLLGFPEGIADYYKFSEGHVFFDEYVYVIIKIAVLVTYFFFIRGFTVIGLHFDNYLLKITTFMLMGLIALTISFDIISAYYLQDVEFVFIMAGISVTFGLLGILFGSSLIRLNKSIGVIALFAGVLEILAGLFFLIVNPIGFIFLTPAELFEIIILFKAIELLKVKEHNK